MTRPSQVRQAPAPPPVVALRAEVDSIPAYILEQQGLSQGELGEFFLAFTRLSAALVVARAAPAVEEDAAVAPDAVRELAPPAGATGTAAAVMPTVAGDIMLTIPDGQPTQTVKRGREASAEEDGDAIFDEPADGVVTTVDAAASGSGQNAAAALQVAQDLVAKVNAGAGCGKGLEPPLPVLATGESSG